jgi:hypothetical protein
VQAKGLAPDADYTIFILQVPSSPFMMAWYQGDLHPGAGGTAAHQFFGIFSIETHVLAPGSVPAPQTDPGVDAETNPATPPVHMYHLGIGSRIPATPRRPDAPAPSRRSTATTSPFDDDHVAVRRRPRGRSTATTWPASRC